MDTDGLNDDERAAACRVVLQSLRPVLVRGECDIPWSVAETWAPEVVAAATRLRERFVPASRRDPFYEQTGVQDVRDPQVWADFVTFVPEALDATFWSTDGAPVHLSDQADCIAVRADDGLLEALTDVLAPVRLVPARVSFTERTAARLRGLLNRVMRALWR
ncbi:MAG TPA: hypothetical protein VFP72_18905 [Kineosporiaceae bacterium]|nr:hypothetical protein [Kineosporiaceae bacterium]